MHELVSHELETAIKFMVQAHRYQPLNDSNRPEASASQLLNADKGFRSKKNAGCGCEDDWNALRSQARRAVHHPYRWPR